jgi:hypothetical protein
MHLLHHNNIILSQAGKSQLTTPSSVKKRVSTTNQQPSTTPSSTLPHQFAGMQQNDEPSIKWAESEAKRLLNQDIREGRVPATAKDSSGKRTMALKDIYALPPEFQLYKYGNFSSRLSSLRAAIKDSDSESSADDKSANNNNNDCNKAKKKKKKEVESRAKNQVGKEHSKTTYV